MGKETFSRIYSAWIVVPVLAVFGWATTRNDKELRDQAQAWLRAYWAYATLSAFPVQARFKFDSPGRVWTGYTMTTAGSRSWERDKVDGKPIGSPYHIDGWGLNWMFYRALNGPGSHLANAPSGWDDYHPPIFNKLQEWNGPLNWSGLTDEDRTSLLALLHNPSDRAKLDYALNLVRGKKLTAFFKMYRFSDGSATITDNFSGLSGATAPLYGFAVDSGGNIGVLSVDPGARPTAGWPGAIGPGRAFVDLEARVATAKRDSGEQLDILAIPKMDLPKGKLVYEIWFQPNEEPLLKTFNGNSVDFPKPSDPVIVPPTDKPPVDKPTQENKDFFVQVGGNKKSVLNGFNLSPKRIEDLGHNLIRQTVLNWELVTKYMNGDTENLLMKKVHIAVAGIFGVVNILGQYLIDQDISKLEAAKKGLRDILNKL
jgi:hypothetical protein